METATRARHRRHASVQLSYSAGVIDIVFLYHEHKGFPYLMGLTTRTLFRKEEEEWLEESHGGPVEVAKGSVGQEVEVEERTGRDAMSMKWKEVQVEWCRRSGWILSRDITEKNGRRGGSGRDGHARGWRGRGVCND